MSRSKRKLLDQRQELIDRYIRLKVYRVINRWGKALARRVVRLKLQWTERKRQEALVSTLETFAFEAARARKNGFVATTDILNIGLFFLIAERDIQAVKIDALTHADPWKRSLAARVMLLTIHELDIDKVAGKKLRQALQDGNVPEDLKVAVTEAMRTIRKSQSRAQKHFTNLRNSTIAHRDADAIRQYRDIIDIDGLEIVKVAAEFYEGTKLFIDVMPHLISHLGTLPALLSQLSAQSNFSGVDSSKGIL